MVEEITITVRYLRSYLTSSSSPSSVRAYQVSTYRLYLKSPSHRKFTTSRFTINFTKSHSVEIYTLNFNTV